MSLGPGQEKAVTGLNGDLPVARRLLQQLRSFWLAGFVVISVTLLAIHGGTLWSALPSLTEWRLDRVFASVAFQLLVWLALAKAWINLMSGAAGHRIGMVNALTHQSLVALGKYLPGKVWGMVARGGLLSRSGMARESIVEVSLIEQALVLHSAAVVAMAAGGMLLLAERGGLSAVVFLVLVASLILGGPVVLPIMRWLSRRLARSGERTSPPSVSFFYYINFLSWYVLSWILFGFLAALVASIVLPDLVLDLNAVLWFVLATSISMTLGFLALFAPAGIGVRDVSLGWLLTFCLTPVDAALSVVVIRLWSVLADAAMGIMPLAARYWPAR